MGIEFGLIIHNTDTQQLRDKLSYGEIRCFLTLVWKHANKFTKNGCRTLLAASNILFSDIRL